MDRKRKKMQFVCIVIEELLLLVWKNSTSVTRALDLTSNPAPLG